MSHPSIHPSIIPSSPFPVHHPSPHHSRKREAAMLKLAGSLVLQLFPNSNTTSQNMDCKGKTEARSDSRREYRAVPSPHYRNSKTFLSKESWHDTLPTSWTLILKTNYRDHFILYQTLKHVLGKLLPLFIVVPDFVTPKGMQNHLQL